MTEFAAEQVEELLRRASKSNGPQVRGRALEDLIAYLFESVPGISMTLHNQFNSPRSQEIDIAFWNDGHPDGLHFLPKVILVECKNWSHPADSAEIAWFDHKVRSRGQGFGIFIAASGITGDARNLSFAHSIIGYALEQKRQLVVITRAELELLAGTTDLAELIKRKLLLLAASGTSIV